LINKDDRIGSNKLKAADETRPDDTMVRVTTAPLFKYAKAVKAVG
jgi:hypothetical protein